MQNEYILYYKIQFIYLFLHFYIFLFIDLYLCDFFWPSYIKVLQQRKRQM